MADAKPKTAADDGRAHASPDGTVQLADGERAWVWVQDAHTGHRYDVRSDTLPTEGLTVVAGYPLNRRAMAREAKPRHVWESDTTEPAEKNTKTEGGR